MIHEVNKDFTIDYSAMLESSYDGQIFKGFCKSKQCNVNIKRLKLRQDQLKMAFQQYDLIKNVKHENIIGFIQFLTINDEVFLISEFYQGKKLSDLIDKDKEISEVNCFKFLKQIVDGMAALNTNNIIHRDIKPDNILITNQNKVKIFDFVQAKRTINDINKRQIYSAKGTPLYAAPQILDFARYSGKCDVWSVGSTLVEMLTKKNMAHKAKNINDLKKINQQIKKSNEGHYILQGDFNPWLKFIVSKMMAFEEEKRWSFFQLQEHINKNYQTILSSFNGYSEQNLQLQNIIHNQQSKLLTTQQSQMILSMLQKYATFLHDKGKIFVETFTKYYQSKQVKKGKICKLILLFLSIAFYLKSIQNINTILKQSFIVLPNATKVKVNLFDEGSLLKLQQLKIYYLQQFERETKKFDSTLRKIKEEILSDNIKKYNQQIMNKYQSLIQNTVYGSSDQNIKYHKNILEIFFSEQCIQIDIENMSQQYLRIYFECLNLLNMNKIISSMKSEESELISKIISKLAKLPLQQVKKQVHNLNKLLLE